MPGPQALIWLNTVSSLREMDSYIMSKFFFLPLIWYLSLTSTTAYLHFKPIPPSATVRWHAIDQKKKKNICKNQKTVHVNQDKNYLKHLIISYHELFRNNGSFKYVTEVNT